MAKRTGKDSVSAARQQEVLTDPSTRHADTSPVRSDRTRQRPGRRPPIALSAAVYSILSVLVWSHVWFEHPRTTTICGCGDSSLFSWFLNWPAYAIRHGLNPLYSNAMGYPHGVNLLSNCSVLALGFTLAPVPSDVLAVRDALDKWGVTTLVLPDQAGLPEYDDVRSVPTVAAVMTAATGALPI